MGLEHVMRAISTDTVIALEDLTVLTASQLKATYPRWLTIEGLLSSYHLFVSYRWGQRDSDIVKAVFDRLTLHALGDNNNKINTFVDTKRLEGGNNFQDGFVAALLKSTMVVTVLSADALDRMIEHDESEVDNLLLEWISALACKDVGVVEKIFPVVMGRW
ncbi:MAG: hypothetical protein ACK56F_06950, partial [bacterium]